MGAALLARRHLLPALPFGGGRSARPRAPSGGGCERLEEWGNSPAGGAQGTGREEVASGWGRAPLSPPPPRRRAAGTRWPSVAATPGAGAVQTKGVPAGDKKRGEGAPRSADGCLRLFNCPCFVFICHWPRDLFNSTRYRHCFWGGSTRQQRCSRDWRPPECPSVGYTCLKEWVGLSALAREDNPHPWQIKGKGDPQDIVCSVIHYLNLYVIIFV